MTIVKVGIERYINVDRMTYVEPGRKGRLTVHFDVGGGDIGGPHCLLALEGDEAEDFKRWLDGQSQNPRA
jgi:hypothetical protein